MRASTGGAARLEAFGGSTPWLHLSHRSPHRLTQTPSRSCTTGLRASPLRASPAALAMSFTPPPARCRRGCRWRRSLRWMPPCAPRRQRFRRGRRSLRCGVRGCCSAFARSSSSGWNEVAALINARARQGDLRRPGRGDARAGGGRVCHRNPTASEGRIHRAGGRRASTAGRMRQPLGVVAGITPFNFPAMVPMWMFPIAIACGNTFVLKPSERDPSASLLLAEMLQAGRAAGWRLQRRAWRQDGGGCDSRASGDRRR